MKLQLKTLSRDEWKGELKKESRRICVRDGFFDGYIGLIRFSDVRKPLTASLNGKTYDILADGVYWLQLAPEGDNWWLTALYDADKNFGQFYFDITDGNFISDTGEPSFYDLMLDVVVMPDGSISVLDRDELDTALEESVITPAQHAQAISDADKLVLWLNGNFERLVIYCGEYFNKLLNELH